MTWCVNTKDGYVPIYKYIQIIDHLLVFTVTTVARYSLFVPFVTVPYRTNMAFMKGTVARNSSARFLMTTHILGPLVGLKVKKRSYLGLGTVEFMIIKRFKKSRSTYA